MISNDSDISAHRGYVAFHLRHAANGVVLIRAGKTSSGGENKRFHRSKTITVSLESSDTTTGKPGICSGDGRIFLGKTAT